MIDMIPENPPAFPQLLKNPNHPFDGLTLRDYFASAALAAMVVRTDLSPHDIAGHCGDIADAMLRERSIWADSAETLGGRPSTDSGA